MKKSIFILFLLFFSGISYATNLNIKVKPFRSIEGAEFSICIDTYDSFSGCYKKMNEIHKNTDGIFKIQGLGVGRYLIAIMHPSSEILLYHIYVSDVNSSIEMVVELDNVVIPKKIDSIRVVGEVNKWSHWKNNQSMSFDETSGLWKKEVDDLNKEYGEFYFIINRNEKTHSTELPVAMKTEAWADFHNYIKKGIKEIIFNPKSYKQKNHNYKVSIKGNDPYFHKLCEKLDSLKTDLFEFYVKVKDFSDLEKYTQAYSLASKKLEDIEQANKGGFNWIFPHYKYEFLKFAPIQKESYLLYNDKSKFEFSELRKSQRYRDLIKEHAKLLYGLQKNELMLTASLINGISNITFSLRHYKLREELNIPYGYLYNFLSELLNETDNQEVCGEILYLRANSMVRNSPEKSEKIYKSIIEKYPNYSHTKDGTIENKIKGLSKKKG